MNKKRTPAAVPVEESLGENLQKLDLLFLQTRLAALLEGEGFASKSFPEQLNLLLEEEVTFRQQRAIKTRIQLARFPVPKTIDAFDFDFQPELDKAAVLSLLGLGFIREKSNIILIGPSGVGKTHLAIALGIAACQGGYTAYFTTFQQMIENLRKAARQERLQRQLKSYCKPHVLIIDELGYLPLDRDDANLFFQLVSGRYERGPIILTSNKSYGDWGEMFPEEGIAAAILDRLVHYSQTIRIRGESYRLAMKRKMGLFENRTN